jgi:hypothetical protein
LGSEAWSAAAAALRSWARYLDDADEVEPELEPCELDEPELEPCDFFDEPELEPCELDELDELELELVEPPRAAASCVQYLASFVFAEPPRALSSVAAARRSCATYLPVGLAASFVR